MAYGPQIEAAKNRFGVVLGQQLERVKDIKAQPDWLDFSQVSHAHQSAPLRAWKVPIHPYRLVSWCEVRADF